MKKLFTMLVLLCAVTSTWAEEASLNAFPTGTTSFANYNWGNSLDKNKVIYDQGNYIMMWSNGNNLAVDANGLKIGNSSKKSAFVFRVEKASDITVGIARNGSDMTASLYYLGETTDVLTDPNSMTPTGALSSVDITSSNTPAELSVEEGAAGYYMVFGTLRFIATSITITPTGPITKSVTFINDAGWENVYVWAWNDSENFTGGEWPGVKMTAVDGEENTYTWSTTGDPTKIIFNNGKSGDGNQTANFDFVDGAKYNSQGRIIVMNTYTATISTDLETVYAYVWSGTGTNKALGEWPGTQLTGEGGTFNVSFEAEEAPEYIIFHNNAGDQTADLEFADGETYAFYKTTYTATFTTDVDWETIYAYVWSGSGDNATNKALGNWPGTILQANEGVYTVSFDAYNAPEKIQFNGGSNDKKAGDWTFKDDKAYKYITATPIYALGANQTFKSGQTELVKDADGDVVATITYGETGGNDFKEPKEGTIEGYTGYTYYTEGNGTNGNKEGGTFYTIVPRFDGTIDLAVIINADKTLIVEEDGVAMGGFETQTEKLYGIQTFAVQAGKSYKCYVNGSKLGFYGFDYKFTKTELAVTDYYLVGGTGDWTVSDAALTEDGDVYSVEVPYESGYSFAIAPNTAILGTIVVDWGKVIRPAAQTEVVFANTTGDASTEDNSQNWKMRTLEDNESNEYTVTLKYNATENTWAIECAATVTISAAGYATYSNAQPYKVEGAEVYTVSEATTKATFNQLPEGAEIPGGTGVILKGEGEVTITPSAGTAEIGNNLLEGSGDYSYTITENDAVTYIFQNGDNGVGFYKVDDLSALPEADRILPAHKAFLKVPAGSAPFFGFADGETTGIESLTPALSQGEGVCYTLDGRRVEKPTKGLYIVNGKKVLVP